MRSVSIKGSPYARFRRALELGDLALVHVTAAELPRIDLDDALTICVLMARTHDGACIYMSYFGVLELNEAVQRALATRGETRWEDQYFRTTPRFETGDERYAWLNRVQAVGKGIVHEDLTIDYEWYELR